MNTEQTGFEKRFTRFRSLKSKLIFYFLLISVVPLVTIAIVLGLLITSVLGEEQMSQLVAVRNFKAGQINAYFKDVDEDLQLLSNLPLVQSALSDLTYQMSIHGREAVKGVDFTKELDILDPFLPYSYGVLHAKYHPFFNEVAVTTGYEDILLVDIEGNVVYSQAKKDDFATNLLDGPYQDTALGQLFRNLQTNPEAGVILKEDYAPYAPAEDIKISFVGIPVVGDDADGVRGFLIYALPFEAVAEVLADDAGFAGVNSYLVTENLFDMATGERIKYPVADGFAGVSDDKIVESNQEKMFIAYQPVETAGLQWVLITEIAQAVALEGTKTISYISIGIFVLFIGLSISSALFIASRIANPISHLTAAAQQVTGGDLTARAQVDNQDEIGELAEAFNTMTTQLRQSFSTLEEQVQERTGELALSLEVGQRVTNIRDMGTLLSTVAEFIWDQFSLYYVQVFLVDDINQNLILRTGTDQIGQELLARNLSLPINTETTVGRAVIERRSIIVSDTTVGSINTGGQNIPAAWYSVLIEKEKEKRPASLLPESLSELAIPLIVEGQVLGVLDLQDDKLRSFTEKGLSVYEAIAVQLSVSIDSARQWELAQQAQKRAEQAVRQLTREGWADRLVSSWGEEEGFVYDLSNVRPLSDGSWVSNNNVSVPLVVQDQAIGQLNVNAADRGLSNDEQALLQSVAQQLSQKAENLRLFEATQQRASREQIARRIIDKIRASRNIETALQTAAEELNKALGTACAVVDLQVASKPHPIPVGEQDADFAEIVSAEDVSADDDGPHEALSLRRYGHSGLL